MIRSGTQVVQREKVKLDWVKSRFELIQAELEANPTLYYVIHGRPYVPPRIVLNKVRLHHHTIFETKSAAPF